MITTPLTELPSHINVAVIGSGAAGLTAATRAADGGGSVVVLEKADLLGGTTAVGGGVIWAPANRLGAEAGYIDTEDDAEAYVTAATAGRLSSEEVEWFVTNASRAVDYLTDHTRVSLTPLARPDYRLDWPGATQGGRSLDNKEFDVRSVPGLGEVIRPSSYFPLLTMAERDALNGASPDPELLASRAALGVRTMGGALVASLLVSALDRGVRIATGAPVTGLTSPAEDNAPWVLTVGQSDDRGENVTITADVVVIASGGFEWNEQMQESFLPHRITPISAPSNEGDGLKLGLQLGAAVSEMTTFWGVPVITPPEQTYDGKPSGRMGNVEMTLPGSIVVGVDGRRFVNEALNYHDVSRVFGAVNAHRLAPQGLPAWLIFDREYLNSYPIAGSGPGQVAEWMIEVSTLAELAERLGVDVETFTDQVERFNADALLGVDSEFGRGSTPQDRFLGDENVGPNPCLRELTEPPFYAVPVHCGTLGTSGGLSANQHGQVLRFDGEVIPGLYTAGNVSASAFKGAYPGGGSTLGSAVVRAFVVGSQIASLSRRARGTAEHQFVGSS